MGILKQIQAKREIAKSVQDPLAEVMKNIVPPDFLAIIYPEVAELRVQYEESDDPDEKNQIAEKISKYKLQQKNYITTTISEVRKLAERLKLNLCTHNGAVYAYNGQYWHKVSDQELKNFLGDCAIAMKVPYHDAIYFEFRDRLLKQFLGEAYLPRPEPLKGVTLINLNNGTLEVSTEGEKLRPHDPKDFITYVLTFGYDEYAKAPKFQKFLDQVLSKEKQIVLSEYAGYTFVPHSSGLNLEKVLLCYGTGANGKSVFFYIMNALLGHENVSNYPLFNITGMNGYWRAMLGEKLLNYSSEIGSQTNAPIFKQLASGEPIEARHPYGKPFTMSNYAKLIFNTNSFLVGEQTDAFFRRFLIIHFDKTIAPEDQDTELAKKIITDELPGVLNWALEGLKRLIKSKAFTYSEEIAKTLEDYRIASDPVRSYLLEEGIEPGNRPYTLKEFYTDFCNFANDNGHRQISSATLKKRLMEIGFETERKSQGWIVWTNKMH